MGYYRGDGTNYYRGDYYRGDPFLGGLVAGAAGKLIGKAARWVGKKVGGAAARVGPGIIRDGASNAVSGAVGYTLGRRGTPMPTLGPLEPMGEMVPMGMAPAKRRRINPLNPKALRRALRRAEGFEKFSKRTVNAMYKVIDGRRVRTFKKKTRSS